MSMTCDCRAALFLNVAVVKRCLKHLISLHSTRKGIFTHRNPLGTPLFSSLVKLVRLAVRVESKVFSFSSARNASKIGGLA